MVQPPQTGLGELDLSINFPTCFLFWIFYMDFNREYFKIFSLGIPMHFFLEILSLGISVHVLLFIPQGFQVRHFLGDF